MASQPRNTQRTQGRRSGTSNVKEKQFAQNLLMKFSADTKQRKELDTTSDPKKNDGTNLVPPLLVEACNLYPRENARMHHTADYELTMGTSPTAVLRRGQPFYLVLRTDKPFESTEDVMRLSFEFGPKPSARKGTKVVLKLTGKELSEEFEEGNASWKVRLHGQDATMVTLEVFISTAAPVGIWNLKVKTNRLGHGEPNNEYRLQDDIYILFNPWIKDDNTYMESEEMREEYVLNDTGKVWCGSFRAPKGRRWIFGQFEDVALPASVYLLEKARVPHCDRGNPVKVVRAISAIINADDDDGLLLGRWDNDYSDGTAPNAWTGSVAIMEQYLSEGGTPVKYGQCWVFSAVTVTVCRALGIPCRSVTNYVSAHDTNSTLTIDKYFDIFGDIIENGPDGDCTDSCWNFHVWTDVWMTRPDLPLGYGGWQVVDATPQEKSESIYCCGPASVEAVRRGEIGLSHDTAFVFAEVNADICHFREDHESDWGFSRMSLNSYHVGRKIVTKKYGVDDDSGDSDLIDITHEYKNPEGSLAERMAVFNALKGVSGSQHYYDLPDKKDEDVFLDLLEIDSIPYGDSFDVTVKIHNKAEESRTITLILSACTVYYTGAIAHRLKRTQKVLKMEANQRETFSLRLTSKEYLDKLVDQGIFKIYALANVAETKQTWSEEDDFILTKPKLNIEINGEPHVGEAIEAIFSFQNTLHLPLTGCRLSVEGPGLQRPKIIPCRDVKPGEYFRISEWFNPKRSGNRKIVSSFYSKEIPDILGSTTIAVQ